jgi:hypothetical protein
MLGAANYHLLQQPAAITTVMLQVTCDTHPLLCDHVAAPLEDENGVATHADGHWQQDERNDLNQVR